MSKPPYSRTGRADKGTAKEIVVNALEYIAEEINRDLEHGKKSNDYITDANSKNLLKAIAALEKRGISCKNSKRLTKELSWFVGGDPRKIKEWQKKLNELNIKGDHGRLEEDGVFGKETLSAWIRFLNTLEHGTLPTLTWIDPLKGHDIKAIGAKAGAIAGGFAGPFAPFAIPVLSLVGGVAGSFSGDSEYNAGQSFFGKDEKDKGIIYIFCDDIKPVFEMLAAQSEYCYYFDVCAFASTPHAESYEECKKMMSNKYSLLYIECQKQHDKILLYFDDSVFSEEDLLNSFRECCEQHDRRFMTSEEMVDLYP